MIRLLLILLAVYVTISCKQTPSLTENDKKLITDTIEQTLANYFSDIKDSGLNAEFRYLDNSPEFFWVPPGFSAAISYDSVAVILRANAPKYKLIDNRFESLQVKPLSSELATYTGRIQSTIIDSSGKQSLFLLVETGVLIKRQDGWKLLNGQTSGLTPQ
jgi:hypothetical protein